jgi:hypothetical protein
MLVYNYLDYFTVHCEIAMDFNHILESIDCGDYTKAVGSCDNAIDKLSSMESPEQSDAAAVDTLLVKTDILYNKSIALQKMGQNIQVRCGKTIYVEGLRLHGFVLWCYLDLGRRMPSIVFRNIEVCGNSSAVSKQ